MAYKNKEDQKAASARHYKKNRQAIIDRAKTNTLVSVKRNRKFLDEYLSTHPCVDCGNDNSIVLEFDHVRGNKKYNIGDMVYKAVAIKTIEDEIAKCDVRCANCHRIVTHERKSSARWFEPDRVNYLMSNNE